MGMISTELCEAIIDVAKDFNASGISVGKSGNISARHDNGFVITPSGLAYSELKPLDLIYCDLEGKVLSGEWQPSTEWPFHAAIYKTRNDIHAIVHTHSTYATALACRRQSIPAFHYMVAIAGGNSIDCADYATFGTDTLSENVVNALADKRACLMANHGQIATGDNVDDAYALAHEVESLARQYSICLQTGEPVLLDDVEMQVNLEKFKTYGKQHRLK